MIQSRDTVSDMLHDPRQWLAFVWSGWTATWPTQLLAVIWIAWVISWVLASFWSGRTKKHLMTWDSRRYRIPILAGAVLFTPWTSQVLGEKPLWQFGNFGVYVMAAVTLAGISFTWWARIHLGRFWSNAITHKEGHRVIDTGPYGLVRHPIYARSDAGSISATRLTPQDNRQSTFRQRRRRSHRDRRHEMAWNDDALAKRQR